MRICFYSSAGDTSRYLLRRGLYEQRETHSFALLLYWRVRHFQAQDSLITWIWNANNERLNLTNFIGPRLSDLGTEAKLKNILKDRQEFHAFEGQKRHPKFMCGQNKENLFVRCRKNRQSHTSENLFLDDADCLYCHLLMLLAVAFGHDNQDNHRTGTYLTISVYLNFCPSECRFYIYLLSAQNKWDFL